jgi:archaemetzincin
VLSGRKDMKSNVLITPTTDFPVDDARYAVDILASKFGQSFEFVLNASTVQPPVEGHNEERSQYSAESFLPLAESLKAKDHYLVAVILTDVDIFAKFTNYVFGLAEMVHRVAVVSSCRIHPSFWGTKENRENFEEQWGKVVTHEFGHTLGLLHCDDWNCVMKYSNSPAELYKKGREFCTKCAGELREIIKKLQTSQDESKT